MGPELIQDYGIIGNGRSAALVGRSGSIDWLCWPRFDSPSLFAALLDRERGGHFEIAPAEPFTATRAYAHDSNVLVTTFTTRGGEVRLTDLMPVLSEEDKTTTLFPEHEILRICECVARRRRDARRVPAPPRLRAPRPFRSAPPATSGSGSRTDRGSTRCAPIGRSPRSPPSDVEGRFPLRAGERATFSLSFDHAGPAVLPPLGDGAAVTVQRTLGVVARLGRHAAPTTGPTAQAVIRSVLVLKLLDYAPSGAIVAAPTTSLPERDRRRSQLGLPLLLGARRGADGVSSLSDLGYEEEASAFFDWLLHSTRLTRPALRVLYDVYGGVPDGGGDARSPAGVPRIASGAHPQRAPRASCSSTATASWWRRSRRCAGAAAALARETQTMMRQLGDFVCDHWRDPDQGIWEPREPPSRHTYSRVMCWVALDRLLQLHRSGFIRRLPADRFERERDAIRAEVEREGFNADARQLHATCWAATPSTPACCCSAATATRSRATRACAAATG